MSLDERSSEIMMHSELDTKNDIVEQDLESHSKGSQQDDFIDKDPTLCEEEEEPLFVIDRTTNFRLNHAIQYESSYPKNNNSRYGSAARSDMGPRQNSCWNCGSIDHALSSCSETRNQWKISQNRKAFLLQKQQQQQHNFGGRNRFSGRNNLRYFVAGTKSLCSEFIAGQLSDDLRKVMDLPENGLPLHVYRMRQYGYPSGWLEEAREKYSGISIFTAPNECLPFPGRENDENNIITCDINIKKLHEYPGFNSPCPPNTVDECKTYGCPEFDPEQNLKLMYERLKFNKKLIEFSGDNKEMGFASISKEKITEAVLNPQLTEGESNSQPPSSPEDGEITDDEDCTEKSPLESTSNETLAEKPADEISHSDTFLSCIDTKESINDSQLCLSTTNNSEFESPPACKKRKFGDVKSEVLGTPILKHVSPYGNRPNHENFAKGMVDMIDHENLPNAVGTFKKLKEILKDVRKTLNNLL